MTTRRTFLAKYLFLKQSQKFWLEGAYAWGLSILLYAVVTFIHFHTKTRMALNLDMSLATMGKFNAKRAELIFIGVPLQTTLLVNLVFFILTIKNIRKVKNGTKILKKNDNNQL